MSASRYYVAWIRDYLEPRAPEAAADFNRALTEFEAAMAADVPSDQPLSELRACVQSQNAQVAENAAVLVGKLADRVPEARQIMKDMLADSAWRVRRDAVIAASEVSPGCEWVDELLCRALHDRSAQVRKLAGSKILVLGLRGLLYELEAALAKETDDEVRKSLSFDYDLLRDGFRAEHRDGGIWLSLRMPGGSVSGTFISEPQAEAEGVKAIAARLGALVS